MHPFLNTAIKAARKAGSIINRAANQLDSVTVHTKAHNDFVTEVDKASETAIIECLHEAYPNHSILAEESGEDTRTGQFLWIIDPLDGTTNFIHGFPQYSISIALANNGIIEQAVIYDPTRNELFYASKGAGAYLDDRRIRVSKRIHLSDSIIGTGFPFRQGDDLESYLTTFAAITKKCAGIRRPGSAALDLAYTACGRLDGFWESGLNIWDIAAGVLLIQEAGGLISDFNGEENYLKNGQIVTATPKVFPQLLKHVIK